MLLKVLIAVMIAAFVEVSEVAAKGRKHIICYHGTWATYRESMGQYDVSQIDPFLCTHLMYAFFGIEESGDLRIIDPYLDLEEQWGRGNIRKFNALKLQNPTLKTLMAVGGWNEGSKNFSIVANDPQKRHRFVQAVVRFIQRHGFDGLDLDWEYPNQRHKLTFNDDKRNYITFLKELKEGLEPFGYLLTAAVGSAEFSASRSYDIPQISQYLDIINVMAYDLHGPWDPVVGINAPLYGGSSDKTEKDKQLNLDAIVKYWIAQGAPLDKLVIGVPFYGRSFTLADPQQHTPGSPHIGRGLAGQYSVEPGVIGYNELCERMRSEPWTVEWEAEQMVPYAYYQRQWVGFESPRSIALKAKYIMEHELAGIMIWSLESDDFRGVCGGGKYPLLREINTIMQAEGGSLTNMDVPAYAHTAKGPTSGMGPTHWHDENPLDSLTKGNKPSDLESVQPEGMDYQIGSELHGSSQNVGQVDVVGTTSPPSPQPLGDYSCKKEEEGYIRDPRNCAQFYFCSGGVTYRFVCPGVLKFDLGTNSCNYPTMVRC